MVVGIITGLYVTPIILRVGTHIYQKGKAKKEAIKNLEDLGYDVNKHYINQLFHGFNTRQEADEYADSESLKWGFILIPLVNLVPLVIDIKYLLGDHTSEPFWDEFAVISDKRLQYLLNEGVISENEEKMQFLIDKNNALKELENKYKDIKVPKDNSIIMISENDSEKELYEKLEQLQEMILRKQNETSNNDAKNLEYKNKEGNKYEKI